MLIDVITPNFVTSIKIKNILFLDAFINNVQKQLQYSKIILILTDVYQRMCNSKYALDECSKC